MDVLRTTAGDVLRAVPWALVTGRDSEFGPQLNWWRGPRWVGMVGGTYAVGPRPDGGFRVAVTLPVAR